MIDDIREIGVLHRHLSYLHRLSGVEVWRTRETKHILEIASLSPFGYHASQLDLFAGYVVNLINKYSHSRNLADDGSQFICLDNLVVFAPLFLITPKKVWVKCLFVYTIKYHFFSIRKSYKPHQFVPVTGNQLVYLLCIRIPDHIAATGCTVLIEYLELDNATYF